MQAEGEVGGGALQRIGTPGRGLALPFSEPEPHRFHMTAGGVLGRGEPLIGRILSVDTTEMEFRVFNLRPDPSNVVTWENRDRIQVKDLDGLCAPWLSGH